MRSDQETLLAAELVAPGSMVQTLKGRDFDGVAEDLRVCLVETAPRREWCDIPEIVDWLERCGQYGEQTGATIKACIRAWFAMPWAARQRAMRRSHLDIDTRPKRPFES